MRERRVDHSLLESTLSKPAFMSKKRVVTSRRGPWRVRILCVTVASASGVLRPAGKSHWLVWRSPALLARLVKLTVKTLYKIFEIVFRRTMMWKEVGVS